MEESEFETSLTSTVCGGFNSSFTFVDKPSNFYFEPIGVDHYMGAQKLPNRKQEPHFDEDDSSKAGSI